MRLDKFLSNNNLGTRTEVKKALRKGVCLVNDEVVKSAEFKITENDVIVYNGYEVSNRGSEKVYILLNKPKGFVSAKKDTFDETVMGLLGVDATKDMFPVGRLDKDTTGLLLITNDGEFAHNSLSPKKHVPKKYFVELDGEIPMGIEEEFKKGVKLNDEEYAKPALIEIVESNKAFVTITEGKYHQIKRMFHRFGLEVLELERVSFGNLELGDDLEVGDYRFLSLDEVENI